MSRPNPTPPKPLVRLRKPLLLVLQALTVAIAVRLALKLRFDFRTPEEYVLSYWKLLPLYLGCQFASMHFFGVLSGLWRYVSMRDAVHLIQACTLGTTLTFLADLLLDPGSTLLPRSVYIMSWALNILSLAGLRFSVRILRESSGLRQSADKRRRTVVIGAGDAGFQIARELLEKQRDRFELLGFLDDDDTKHRQAILTLPILGGVSQLERLRNEHDIQEAIIAMPSAGGRVIRTIQQACQENDITVRVLPGLSALIQNKVAIAQVRPISVEDLLRRPSAELDLDAISEFLRGKRVLVTGAGGSIGSELCRQVARFGPEKMILVDQGETPLYAIELQLREDFSGFEVHPILTSIDDTIEMERAFEAGVDVVFHAAAYKHVPLLEKNPAIGLRNNIGGTQVVAKLAVAHEIDAFVMVSTDKAVRPTSLMGASKRICEMLLQSYAASHEKTRFVTVRFGNVLGSNGSVVPRFRKQIEAGGPITVTHPDITRFFMTIPEASQLVLQAATMGKGGEIFILEMGEPIKIVELARDLISLSGLQEGEDIEIEFTGLRPGEKLHEELLLDEESTSQTVHPAILLGQSRIEDPEKVLEGVQALLGKAEEHRGLPELRSTIADLVPDNQFAVAPDAD